MTPRHRPSRQGSLGYEIRDLDITVSGEVVTFYMDGSYKAAIDLEP
jgi:hypothetical protein